MLSRSDGKACPDQGIEHVPGEFDVPVPTWTNGDDEFGALAALHPGPAVASSAEDTSVEIARLNADQIGGSWSLPVDEGAAARVRCWHGRKHWLYNLGLDLDTDRGRALISRHGTSIGAVQHLAPVVAGFANSLTGRRVTASHATIAEDTGYSAQTLRKTLYVLRDLGYAVSLETGRPLNAVEIAAAKAHHGGFQTKAASVWNLTVPATADALPAKPLTPRRNSASLGRISKAAHHAAAAARQNDQTERGHLSSRTSVLEESPVGKNSPTRARAHAGLGRSTKSMRKSGKNRKDRQEPHPLHRQRAAAELVSYCHGLDRGQWAPAGSRQYVRLHGGWHIGAVCDIFAAAGIDTTAWSGRAIGKRATEWTIERGLTWPNHLRNPIGFLRALLLGLDWAAAPPAGTATSVQVAWTQRCQEHPESGRRGDGECSGCWVERMTPESAPESPAADPTVPTPPVRYVRRSTNLPAPRPAEDQSTPGLPISPDAADTVQPCTACGDGLGVMREQLLIPTPVCDSCWSTAADPAGPDEDELAVVVGEQCTVCAAAPGSVRESLPSRSVVCDHCWDVMGLSSYEVRRSVAG